MRITLVIILGLAFSGICLADVPTLKDDKPVEPTEIAITNEEKLSLENFQLKVQLLEEQLTTQRMGLDAYVQALVAKYKIAGKDWRYDPTGKFVKIKMQGELKKE